MELQIGSPAIAEALRAPGIAETTAPAVRETRPEVTRPKMNRRAAAVAVEEVIVPDQRAGLTPAQAVEQKLTAMLRGGAAIPVSHFRLAKLCRKG
ncbi:MAG TPA: hypothetical protein VH120_18140 [Gemmataceae bacterium]|jgi:hypothetical protein|nr:hypothetical protein [Gemmataceae bacterium]